MKKETSQLIRKLLIGSLALIIFSVVILSSIRMAFPEVIELWVVFVVGIGSAVVFVAVILLIDFILKRRNK